MPRDSPRARAAATSDSPTGQTNVTESAAATVEKLAPPEFDKPAPADAFVGLRNASAKVVTRVSAALGVVAAVLTSGLATMILSIAPHASDLWGLRAVAALLRIIFLAGVLLRAWLHRHEDAIGAA